MKRHHLRPHPDPLLEVHDVFIQETDAARHMGADARRFIGPVNTVKRVAEIKRAGAGQDAGLPAMLGQGRSDSASGRVRCDEANTGARAPTPNAGT